MCMVAAAAKYGCVLATGILVIMSLLSLWNITDASAHPFYVNSDPRPFQNLNTSPQQVNVFFSEPLELAYSKISVLGPDGSRVDLNDPNHVEGDTASIGIKLKPDLSDGIYTVNTRVLSQVDGHVVDNSFTFGIGTGVVSDGSSEAAIAVAAYASAKQSIFSPLDSVSRFPGFVGQIMVVGAAFASMWIWKPVGKVPWLSSALVQQRITIDKRMMLLAIIGTTLILASGIAMIFSQSIAIDSGITEAIATKFGNVWIVRMLQASVLMLITLAIYRKVAKKKIPTSRRELLALLITGLAVILTSSLIAHAAATEQLAAIIIDFFHHTAASIWIGGLIFLGFAAVPELLKIPDVRVKAAAISIFTPRFSIITVTIIGVVMITGPLLLWMLESDLSLTIASSYGKILAAKLSLAAVMIGLGAYNQFVVQRKSAEILVSISNTRGGRGGGGDKSSSSSSASHIYPQPANNRSFVLSHFDKSLKAEAAVGIGLLLMVSFMTNMALPSGEFPSYERQHPEQSAFAQEQGGRLPTESYDYFQIDYLENGRRVDLSISPFLPGQNNSIKVEFLQAGGGQDNNEYNDSNKILQTVSSIESATIKLTNVEKGISPIKVEMEKISAGEFTAQAPFSIPGMWLIEVEGETIEPGMPNIVTSFEVIIKPEVSDLQFAVKEYKTPEESLPLYPLYDSNREAIWIGDTLPKTGRIWQFDLKSENYVMHTINGTNLITVTLLDSNGDLWYADPSQGILGRYTPETKENRQYTVPGEDIISGLAIDPDENIWFPAVQANKVIRFESEIEKFTEYQIPTENAGPAGISVDKEGNIWFAESIGKVARIDPETGNVTEFAPKEYSLDQPTAVLPDPRSSNIYISEHEGHRISVLNPLFGLFKQYPSANEQGLPFGMTFDSYNNLWFAEHTIDRIGVIDPRTGVSTEAEVPTSGSFIQWITTDNSGRVWFAEQRGSAIGSITISAKPTSSSAATTAASSQQDEQRVSGKEEEIGKGIRSNFITDLGFRFADIVGPAIAAGIILSALFYSKNVRDMRRNVRIANNSAS